MSSGSWQDRRGLFQKGKEVHQPSNPQGRKFSETGVTNAVRRASTSSNSGDDKASPTAFPTASSPRRSSGMGNLTNMKRGSDASERRTSQQEMAGGGGGMLSGWFNQTFKGHDKPGSSGEQK